MDPARLRSKERTRSDVSWAKASSCMRRGLGFSTSRARGKMGVQSMPMRASPSRSAKAPATLRRCCL
eukprot:1969383-Lingulodinium_polyedra.AAC.1